MEVKGKQIGTSMKLARDNKISTGKETGRGVRIFSRTPVSKTGMRSAGGGKRR